MNNEPIFDIEISYYEDSPVEAGCVSGGGGCSCSDGLGD